MTKSKRRQKCVKNLTPDWNQNNNTSFHLLRIIAIFGIVAVSIRFEEKFFEEGPLFDLFCPALDQPLDGSGQIITKLVRDQSTTSLPSLIKIYLAVLGKKLEM